MVLMVGFGWLPELSQLSTQQRAAARSGTQRGVTQSSEREAEAQDRWRTSCSCPGSSSWHVPNYNPYVCGPYFMKLKLRSL